MGSTPKRWTERLRREAHRSWRGLNSWQAGVSFRVGGREQPTGTSTKGDYHVATACADEHGLGRVDANAFNLGHGRLRSWLMTTQVWHAMPWGRPPQQSSTCSASGAIFCCKRRRVSAPSDRNTTCCCGCIPCWRSVSTSRARGLSSTVWTKAKQRPEGSGARPSRWNETRLLPVIASNQPCPRPRT